MTMIRLTPHPTRNGVEILEASVDLAAPIDEVFQFFSEARNLEAITPRWLSFQVKDAPEREIKEGDLIDYRLKVRGVPITWRSEITEWNPPFMFADTQLKGPYRLWHHTHEFQEIEGGTRCIDRVLFQAPFGWLTHGLFVRRDVRSIFQHRLEVLSEKFGLLELNSSTLNEERLSHALSA